MATRDEPWPQGTPSWVDLMVDDAEAAARFYGDLFGWESEAGSPETGGYRIAMLGGRAVAGIGSVPPGAQMPSVWTTYIAVDDLDATATRVTEHGGTIMMGPMDVMDQGRVAVAADPTGAVFGMWQAQQHIGAGRVNEAGTRSGTSARRATTRRQSGSTPGFSVTTCRRSVTVRASTTRCSTSAATRSVGSEPPQPTLLPTQHPPG